MKPTVPAGALSFDIFAEAISDPTARVAAYTIKDPNLTTLYSFGGPDDPIKVLEQGAPVGSFSVLVPNTPSLTFSTGTWAIRLFTSKTTTAAVKAIIKSGTSPTAGNLNMNLFFVGTGNVTASTAPTDPTFQSFIAALRNTIYSQVGIQIGQVNYLDITGNAAAQYADLNDAQLGDLMKLSAAPGTQSNAVNLFFVHTIQGGSTGYTILGESAGIPGHPLAGTTGSGVAVSMSDFGMPGSTIFLTWAHEMGHFLGLFHPTEASGTSFDTLADTPQCNSSHDTNGDGIVDPSECSGFGADNLMFWTGNNNFALTPNQGFVMLRNPLIRDAGPSIAVEQPAGVNLVDGTASVDFGSVGVGSNADLGFTIRNNGSADLTGLGITIDGTDAGLFTVTASPTAPVVSGGSTTFTVRFAPTGSGSKTAALHIASNDTNASPFDIGLTGSVQNGSPNITTPVAGLSRQRGTAASNSVIATVSDPNTPAGSLTVNAVSVPPGLTISNIVNTNGSVTADIAAGCTAATGFNTIFLQVSDGSLTNATGLAVKVTANTKPTLTYNNPAMIAVGGSTTVNPATSSDNGTTTFTLKSQGTYTGTISVNPSTGVVSISNAGPGGSPTITVTATDNCGATTDASFSLSIADTAPSISPTPIGRQKGTAAFSSTIATVSDAQSSAGSLTVTATTVPIGLTISNIVNTNGTITAKIAASCDYAVGHKTIVLQVSDGYLTATGNLDVDVIANPIPTLSYNNQSSIPLNSSLNVSPASASDNGSITNFSIVSQGTYTGTIFINPLTGVVSFSNAAPAGTHTITIRATDNCGATKDASFTLPVFDSASLDSLDPNIQSGGYVKDTALQPDGKLIIAGSFASVLGVTRNNIARLNADGTLDMTFDPNALTGEVDSVVVQSDGKVLLAGFFTDLRPNGVTTSRNGIARVNTDGTVDLTFDPNPAGGGVSCLALQPDGKILVGGSFTFIGGQTRSRIARLNTNGTADTFNPNVTSASTGVASIAVQADGKVVFGGSFTTLRPNGVGTTFTRNRIARVDSTGAVDTFDPNVSTAASGVGSIAVQADGKVLLGGTFTTVGGQTRNRIARVDSTGALDTFNPNIGSAANLQVYSLAVQTDGKVLLGGVFTTLQPNSTPAPTTRNRIARVNSDGTLDTGFDPNADSPVMTIALQPDGKVLLGGQFTTLKPNGAAVAIPRNWFARLFNDPVTQSLTAPFTTQALWSRSGAGPEVSQVTFELSTNGGSSYTPLGNATRVGTTSNWQLTGLSLPTSGQLRARGRTTDGIQNSGSGLIEQVATYTAIAPGAFILNITQKGTATYSVGSDTTSMTISFTCVPNISLNMQYSTDLINWVSYTGNPVSTGALGSFSVPFTASGNQTATWNKKMFFRAASIP